ncbi:MAG: hypothetical protein J7556_22105 [Acidovorax sp.]|nr:hypothetical protein [Acidovorax sp.]
MTPAKLWLRIFATGFAVFCVMLLITLATPIPYGDLSRIGRLSDHQFGWQKPPPQVAHQDLQNAPLDQADVVLIGDSFSMTHHWQSVLAKAGYRIASTFWTHINAEALCGDLDDWLAHSGFHGKLIIIQSVERNLSERLAASTQCTKMAKPFIQQAGPYTMAREEVPGFKLNWDAPIAQGLITYWNTRKALNTPGDTTYKSGAHLSATMVRAVPDGCNFFSHRLCSKALFLSDDINRGELTPADAETMKTFAAARRTPVLWMVIPNKTTVYIDPSHSTSFVSAFRNANLGPDLFEWAAQRHALTRDFYFPNDTHLSMHGQLELGELMLNEVRSRLPGALERSH